MLEPFAVKVISDSSLFIDLVKPVVPVVVGGLLAWWGVWYGQQQGREMLRQSHALESERARKQHLVELRTRHISEFLEATTALWMKTTGQVTGEDVQRMNVACQLASLFLSDHAATQIAKFATEHARVGATDTPEGADRVLRAFVELTAQLRKEIHE